jgi:hypothetical protein
VGIGPVAVGATLLLSPVVERPQVPSSVARRAPKCPDPSKSPPSRLQVASKSPPSRLQVASKSPPSRLLVASQSARHDFPAAGSSYEDPAEALGKWSCKWNRNRRGRTSRASARGSPTPRTVRTRIGASEFLQLPPPPRPAPAHPFYRLAIGRFHRAMSSLPRGAHLVHPSHHFPFLAHAHPRTCSRSRSLSLSRSRAFHRLVSRRPRYGPRVSSLTNNNLTRTFRNVRRGVAITPYPVKVPSGIIVTTLPPCDTAESLSYEATWPADDFIARSSSS